MDKKKLLIILSLIVLLGAFLRFYNLGKVSFVADEFLDINSSYAYFKTGVWQNWDFNQGTVNVENAFAPRDERAWGYKWQVAQLFRFFAPTETTARAVSASWGILTIILMFLVARDFTKRTEIGLLSAFFFAVSISGIIFDRRLRMYAMFFPVFLLFSWLTFKFLESDYGCNIKAINRLNSRLGVNLVFLVPAILAGLLSLHLHQLAGNMLMVVAAYLGVRYFLTVRSSKKYFNKDLAYLGLIAAGALAMQILAPALVGSFFAGLVFFTDHLNYFSITLKDYSHLLIALLLVVLGAYFLIKSKETKKEGIWIAVSYLVPLLAAMFLWRRNVGEQYIFFVQSFVIILLSSGVYFLAKFLSENLSRSGSRVFGTVVVLACLIVPNFGYFFEKNNAYRQTSSSDNPNYRSIFAYFKKNKNHNDILITRNFRNYYWSGEKVETFDFGGELSEKNFSLADLRKIMDENPSGWFIFSANDEDYISNEAEDFAEQNLTKINAIAVRGDVKVYRWGK